MGFYDRLMAETAEERNNFRAIPIIQEVMRGGATHAMYLDFLSQAYHHVRHTFSLLALAASRTTDFSYQKALLSYMNEERGHDEWILDDIRSLGGDAEAVRNGKAGPACQIMVGYSYYAIEHVDPYALLGSVHVLEGMSAALAELAANSIQKSLDAKGEAGFTYLRSHGALDIEHVAFFKTLVDDIVDARIYEIVLDSTRMFYRLYGDIFRELGARHAEKFHAA
jgi:pyrroloquinoline quinone (PQQ) biosynthesis protein C